MTEWKKKYEVRKSKIVFNSDVKYYDTVIKNCQIFNVK